MVVDVPAEIVAERIPRELEFDADQFEKGCGISRIVFRRKIIFNRLSLSVFPIGLKFLSEFLVDRTENGMTFTHRFDFPLTNCMP